MIPTQTKLIDSDGNAFGLKTVNGKPRVSSMTYLYDIAEGNIPDHGSISKFGYDATAEAGNIEVWSGSRAYPYMTTASTLYLSSSDTNDDQPYRIFGLDEYWDEQEVEVTANGFVAVELPGTWIRVFRVINLGITNNAGIIYISLDADPGVDGIPDTIATDSKAEIPVGYNQTLMSIWSVPRDYKAYVTSFYASCAAATSKPVDIGLWARPFGGVFQIKKIMSIDSGSVAKIVYDFPLLVEGKSDIRITANASGASQISAGFDLWYEKG